MQITLYYAPIACSLVPYVGLTEAGANFDVKVVNFLQGEHLQPQYLAINPKHKVPALDVDGAVLTENVAILQWLARTFGEANLLPSGADEFKAVSLMSWCASGIHPTLTPNVLPQRYCDMPGSEEHVKACAHKMMFENFSIAEKLLNGEWFFTDFSLPDVYFYWCFRRAKQFGLDVSPYPNCNAHFDRVEARASVQKVLQFEAEALKQMTSTS